MITEGSPRWDRGTNLHSVWCHKLPLGVTCTCGRKAVVPLHKLGQIQSSMRPIHSLKLRCRGCGGSDWKATLFVTLHEVEAFKGAALTDEELVP